MLSAPKGKKNFLVQQSTHYITIVVSSEKIKVKLAAYCPMPTLLSLVGCNGSSKEVGRTITLFFWF